MNTDLAKKIFQKLYANVDGYALSTIARKNLSYYYVGHVYGEVTFAGFSTMLEYAEPKKGEIFYDLGSGTGKPTILASLLYDFAKVVGVEMLKELHDGAVKVHQNYVELMKKIPELNPKRDQNIQFILSDFHKVDFSDADIIFINATCMGYEFGLPMIRKIEALKKGTRIITNTMQINAPSFIVKKTGICTFTWGDESIFIHEKVR